MRLFMHVFLCLCLLPAPHFNRTLLPNSVPPVAMHFCPLKLSDRRCRVQSSVALVDLTSAFCRGFLRNSRRYSLGSLRKTARRASTHIPRLLVQVIGLILKQQIPKAIKFVTKILHVIPEITLLFKNQIYIFIDFFFTFLHAVFLN